MCNIKEIELKNYRCFKNSKLTFKDVSIIVGKNNAGKSSLIEAIRMISFASRKAQNTATLRTVPVELGASSFDKGIKIDVDALKIDLRGVVYLYSNEIATITATFNNNCKIKIFADNENAYAVFYDSDNSPIRYGRKVTELGFGKMAILPQLSHLKENEKRFVDTTVIKSKETYLSSSHFRNEILLYKNDFWEDFKQLAENSWHGLRISEPEHNYFEGNDIILMVQDDNFTAEIGNMGSGLQMWLQIIWFICKNRDSDTIILDEPDIFMHPDLQKKLINIVKRRFKQTIIATHSIEIITEAEPKNIVMIDKESRRMKYANTLEGVQNIIDNIGGVQNLALVGIGLKKRCVFLEGKDAKILKKMYEIVYPDAENIFNTLPLIELKGACNLPEAFGTARLFHQETAGNIKTICVLDRDYYSDEYHEKQIQKAEENHLHLHIWKRKEIENYLIVPDVLYRIVDNNNLDYNTFIDEFECIVESYKYEVEVDLAEFMHIEDKKLEFKTCIKNAKSELAEKWGTLNDKLAIVPGKAFLKRINSWMYETYGVRCSKQVIIDNMKPSDVDNDIISLFKKLEKI